MLGVSDKTIGRDLSATNVAVDNKNDIEYEEDINEGATNVAVDEFINP